MTIRTAHRTALAAAAIMACLCGGNAAAGAAQAVPADAALSGRAGEAEDRERAIMLGVTQELFDAMEAADNRRLSGLFLPGTIVTSQRFAADGTVTLRRTPVVEWIDSQRVAGRIVERMWSPTILHRGPIAVVWTPYSLDIAGQRSHCGIDSFELVRVDGVWKIAGLSYTVEPRACEALGAR